MGLFTPKGSDGTKSTTLPRDTGRQEEDRIGRSGRLTPADWQQIGRNLHGTNRDPNGDTDRR